MNTSKSAKQLLQESIIIDGQLGFEKNMPWSFAEKWALVERYRQAGFTAITLSIANEEDSTESTLAYLAKIRKYIFEHPEKYLLATSREDILQAKRENRLAIRLMFQGSGPIGKNLELLELFKSLGISSMVLAYNIRTPMGDGVIEENDAGLSHLGRKLVAEMNRLGMIVDGAHSSNKTVENAAEISTAPIVISHSGTYGVHAHPRNAQDHLIKAVARTGGLIGINGIGTLLGHHENQIEALVNHINHVSNLVGETHVAIGLDHLYFANQFDEFMQNQRITHPETYALKAGKAQNWKSLEPEAISGIIEQLIQQDYSETAIKNILGGNILRLMPEK